MNTDEVLDVFREAGALLEGHFILSSGRRKLPGRPPIRVKTQDILLVGPLRNPPIIILFSPKVDPLNSRHSCTAAYVQLLT